MKGCGEIDGKRRIPLVDGEVDDGGEVPDDRIVDENVHAPDLVQRRLDQPGHFATSGEVGLGVAYGDARLAGDFPAGGLERGRALDTVEHEVAAGSRQIPCDRQSKTAGRSRDERATAT